MAVDDSTYLEIIKETLTALAKVRTENGRWSDAEKDEAGVFKIGEALRPFYLAAVNCPESFGTLPLQRSTLLKDTKTFFSAVKKSGFAPTPYAQVESSDEYTDFAAFSIEFSDLVCQYLSKYASTQTALAASAKETASRAFDFLCDRHNSVRDDKGVRWAGTTGHTVETKKVKHYYTDTYFTAVVVLALHRALDCRVLALTKSQKDKVRSLLSDAGSWLVDRAHQGLLTGDEKRDSKQLIYSTWGMRAIADTFAVQEQPVQSAFKSYVTSYLEELQRKLDQDGVSVTQDYIIVFSPKMEARLNYEERASWAGILLALISFATVPDMQALLEETAFSQILERVFTGLLRLRDPASNLWYQGYPIVSIHSYLIEAFLRLAQTDNKVGYGFEVTGSLVQRAIKEVFEDPDVMRYLQYTVYTRLLQLVSAKTSREKVNAAFQNSNKDSAG